MADRFPLRPGRLLTVTLAALVAGCTSAPTPRAGQPPPELWLDLDDDQVVVAWIFRAEDCLSCNTPVRPFRQLQARYADRVRF